MELLSPAGNREALEAAIACGADAVYLGYTAFGARSYASNFDEQGLREALDFAHEWGKRVYVTVNTLVKPGEVDDLCRVLALLCRLGADAALVQDMGALRIARARFPELTLHASTQMTIHNAQGARLMRELGLTRVVPARECSLAELRRMADEGVEIETFAHGALCVAVSGQCLFSSMIGGRSGNRGRCAQPCRLPYQLDDGQSGCLLSTRDLMLIGHLPALRDAGVCSLKLEGRMKRPEYVGVVTRAYREALDACEAGVPYTPSRAVTDGLRQIFHRGGFTEGYAMGQSNAALMSWSRPNHEGVCVGSVRSVRGLIAQVALTRDLHDGDGLQVRGRTETDLTYSGADVSAGQLAAVRVPTGDARPGDAVYRLTDAAQMADIRAAVAQGGARIVLDGELTAQPGSLPVLMLRDADGHVVTATGEQPVQAAQSRALDEQMARKQLGKMGGTPYALGALTLQGEGAFMTASALNALRRDALAAMQQARVQRTELPVLPPQIEPPLPRGARVLIARVASLDWAETLLDAGADVIEWSPQEMIPAALIRALEAHPRVKPCLVLPAFLQTEELDALHAFACAHAARLAGVVVSNPGQLALAWPVPLTGDQTCNVMNADCARFFAERGVGRQTASCELSAKELSALFASGGDYAVEAYGRTQLMLLNHCPHRTQVGDTVQDAACNACAAQGGSPAVYTDRKGYRFPAIRLRLPHGCVVRLYNSVVTDMARHAARLHALGCSLRLHFTDESLARAREITVSYRQILDTGVAAHQPQADATSGHLLRGVE